MSLIKLAFNEANPSYNPKNNITKKNFVAAMGGGSLGFAAKETIEHIPGFDKTKILHRFGSRMGTVTGGLIGAGLAYNLMNVKNKHKNVALDNVE